MRAHILIVVYSCFVSILLLIYCISPSMAMEALPEMHSSSTLPMHVAIISIPLHGHLKPLEVIGEEFIRRGHRITYFNENPKWCDKVRQTGETVNCILMPSHGTFPAALFENASRIETILFTMPSIFAEGFRHHELHLGDYLEAVKEVHAKEPFGLIITDITTFISNSIARALHIPLVVLFPFTTMLPLGVSNEIPAMGTGWPAQMNTWQRVANYLFKSILVAFPNSLESLNLMRSKYGIEPIHDAYELGGWYDTLLAPTIWGFDIPHELCPNFHPLGLLTFPDDRTPPMEEKLVTFLNHCIVGAIYVNFGTLSVPDDRQLQSVADALQQLPYCVIWKLKKEKKEYLMQKGLNKIEKRTFIRSFFTSPHKIMRHERVLAFISHCGDASVHEALDAQLPIVGIPYLADQSDVCQRVEESGIGKYVGHKNYFTSNDILKSIKYVTSNSNKVKKNMERLINVSKFLGGAGRAVEILESRYYNKLLGRNETLERCVLFNDGMSTELNPLRAGRFDILFVWLLVLVPVWVVILTCFWKFLNFMAVIFCKRSTTPVKKRPRFIAISRVTQPEKENGIYELNERISRNFLHR